MLPFRGSQLRRWGGAFRGFDGAGLWCRRRSAGHDADGTVVDALTEIDGHTIIFKRHTGLAPSEFPESHIGARVFEVPNSHRHRDHEIVMTSSGAPCLAAAAVGCHRADVLQLPPELKVIAKTFPEFELAAVADRQQPRQQTHFRYGDVAPSP